MIDTLATTLFGYELNGNLYAAAVTLAVLIEAAVLYVVYEGLNRIATSAFETENDPEPVPDGGER